MGLDYASGITLTRHGDYRIGQLVRAASASPDFGGPDRTAKNVNSIYAGWAPSILAQECYDADGDHQLSWTNAAPLVDLLAFRFLVPGDTIHGDLKADLLAGQLDNGGASGTHTVQLTTINGADSAAVSVTATTPAWHTTDAVAYAADAGDREIAVVSAYRDSSTWIGVLQHLHLYHLPYTGGAGALPSGVETSGWFAHDLAQYDSQSPLSAGALRELYDSQTYLRTAFPWPVGAMAVDLRGLADPKSVPGGVQVTYPVQVFRVPYWRRRGEGVDTLAYSLLGATEAGGSGGKAVLRARVAGNSGAELDETGALTLPTSPDHTDSADWLDGTLDIGNGPIRRDDSPQEIARTCIWVEAYVYSNVATEGSAIVSLSVQESPA